uniref:Clan AA aspartic protease n=1 Tax=Thermofilum adornatum TaxID=1365176 RepID=A0A7C1GB11_9CREN
MVGRVYIPIECTRFVESFSGKVPALRVKFYNFLGEELGPLDIPIDTGFSGSIMVETEEYDFFRVGELPRELWRTYRTLTGPLPMRTARAILEVGGKKLEVFVESPYYGGGKRLVGREVLSQLVLVLDSINYETCIAETGEK